MKKNKASVVIAGYYGFDNAGDELLLLSFIQQIRKHSLGARITVLSHRPERTAAQFEVVAVNRWKPWTWIRPLRQSELFILGGGGLLQESTGPWNHFYYLGLVALAKMLSCRTEVRAVGVDPVKHWWNRMWTKLILNHWVDFLSVRDIDSQKALEMIGVRARVWRQPDPVFLLELPKVQKPMVERARIAWALSPWPQRPGWEHDISAFLERISAKLWVTHDLLVFFPEADEALARKVADLTSLQVGVRIWQKPQDLLTWIQHYDLVVGMRYHALVLAALAECTFIGWGFQRKVRTLCLDFTQPMWTFERGWDPDAVFRQFCDAFRRRRILADHYKGPLKHMLTAAPVANETARIFVPQA